MLSMDMSRRISNSRLKSVGKQLPQVLCMHVLSWPAHPNYRVQQIYPEAPGSMAVHIPIEAEGGGPQALEVQRYT